MGAGIQSRKLVGARKMRKARCRGKRKRAVKVVVLNACSHCNITLASFERHIDCEVKEGLIEKVVSLELMLI